MGVLHVGVVDVLVVSPSGRGWKVLTLERAAGVRCPGAWEIVHGRVRRGETPHAAAVRELREETGLAPERLYNVTVHAFYLHQTSEVKLAAAFCAFVPGAPRPRLGREHAGFAWMPRAAAAKRLAWPSERDILARAYALLRTGDAGAVEDVLRVR